MKSTLAVEGTAKNINDAIEIAVSSALDQLGLPREKVTYELVSNKKQGFLGLGGVSVKLNVFYETGVGEKTKDFLKGLFDLMHVSADIAVTEQEDGSVDVKLSGEDMGLLIGHRGETLDAIQYIAGLAANKGSDEFCRVTIDSENYREKREEALVALANKIADKVLKNQRSMSLEPMNPHERRIIHASLQNKAGVTTFSTGEDPQRRVVIAPTTPDGKPKTRRPNGGKSGNGNGNANPNGGKGKPGNAGGQGYRGPRKPKPKTEKKAEGTSAPAEE